MKTCIKNLFLLPALIAGLGLMLAGRVTAQTFTNLHSFIGSDGANSQAGLILSGNTLYGTTAYGSSSSNGTVFAVNTDGTGFTNLYNFTATSGSFPNVTNSDGANPQAGLILFSNVLYGTAFSGGSSGNGTVFAVNTNGTSFTNLYNFTGGSDGARPQGGLVLSSNILYGTTAVGGISAAGTVFAIHTDGTRFTNLHGFTGSDGARPLAGLILSDNTLYGTTAYGGNADSGTVFRLNTDGTGFTNIYSFTERTGFPDGFNSDGAVPSAGLILSGNTLYGTARGGGSSGNGTMFALNTDGTGFTNLHIFTGGSGGAAPSAGLILSGNTLYGTADAIAIESIGEPLSFNFAGTVFKINTDGTGFTNLYSFTEPFGVNTNSDGALPAAGLILSGNTLYGTASSGGIAGNGTVFSVFIPPQLTIIPSGNNIILTWPTNAIGFILQSTTNLVSSSVWSTNLPSPVIVNGQNTVTNPIAGTQKFYRLSQ